MASMDATLELEKKYEALKLDYEENKNIIAHNIDAFFLIVVAIVIYCKYYAVIWKKSVEFWSKLGQKTMPILSNKQVPRWHLALS